MEQDFWSLVFSHIWTMEWNTCSTKIMVELICKFADFPTKTWIDINLYQIYNKKICGVWKSTDAYHAVSPALLCLRRRQWKKARWNSVFQTVAFQETLFWRKYVLWTCKLMQKVFFIPWIWNWSIAVSDTTAHSCSFLE